MPFFYSRLCACFSLFLSGVLGQQMAHAQVNYYKQPTMVVEAGLRPVAYRGDLQPGFQHWDAAFDVALLLKANKRLTPGLVLAHGRATGQNLLATFISGQDAEPNRYFRTTFTSMGFQGKFSVLKKDFLNIYLGQTLGVMRYTPKDEQGRSLLQQPLTRLPDEAFTGNTLLLVTAAGATYYFKNGFGMGFQMGFQPLLTDYFDNISQAADPPRGDQLLFFRFSGAFPLSFQQK